jgi:hypothetical protein
LLYRLRYSGSHNNNNNNNNNNKFCTMCIKSTVVFFAVRLIQLIYYCIFYTRPAQPSIWCGQLQQNVVRVRATRNSVYRIKDECRHSPTYEQDTFLIPDRKSKIRNEVAYTPSSRLRGIPISSLSVAKP